MLMYIMFMYAMVTSTSCQTSEQLLRRAQKLCNLCQTIPNTPSAQSDTCNALKDFCSSLMLPDKPERTAVPIIASDDLMSELEGDELPEFPTIEEIGIYRPEEDGDIISPHKRFERRRLRMLIQQHDLMDTRMFSSTAPKKARDLFGEATTLLIAFDESFDKMTAKGKKKPKKDHLATLESLYLNTIRRFLDAHDAGSPCALKEVQGTLFGAHMQHIMRWKTKIHGFTKNQKFVSLCQDLAQRTYYQPHADANELYCYSQLAIADINMKYYKHHSDAYSIESIMYEQACYVIARKLLQAHDMGHPEALNEVVQLMSSANTLRIIELRRLHTASKSKKLTKEELMEEELIELEFTSICKEMSKRRQRTHPLVDAQQIVASSSFSSATPLPPCSSTDLCDIYTMLKEPPIDDPKD